MLIWVTRLAVWILISISYSAVFAIPTVSIKGSKFFTSDGNQFFIKGVSYAVTLSNSNNIVNGTQCELDAPRIKELGANTIRVYSVDPTLNHDACMSAFEKNGIYVMLDMATPELSINRNTPQWTKELRNAFAQVIDGFHKYDNLLGFFAGNEIVNDAENTSAAAYVKAVIADMKAYRDVMQYREIPIGYSAADIASLRVQQQDYFNCGNDSVAADFFGAIRYSWCNSSSMAEAGYDTLYDQIEGYSIPYFLAETGCKIDTKSRTFTDQIAILGRQMNDRISGNIIYQWYQLTNGYGLVSYANTEAGTGRVSTLQDFSNLQSQWATLDPTGIKASDYNPTLTRRDCPKFTSGAWNLRANEALPTLGVEGFTTPTRPRTTSTAPQTGTTAASAATSGSNTNLTNSNTKQAKSKGILTKTIVGIVLGVLIGIALILGALLIFLRRVRKQREAKEANLAGVSRDGGESNKVAGSEEYYGPSHHELHGNGTMQELDPARGEIATMRANEMALQGSGQADEMYNEQHNALLPGRAPTPESAAIPATAAEPSPYVQAQRKVEMSWLESEEAKLRQRREELMKQAASGGE